MASLGIDPTDLIRALFGSRSAMLPMPQRQGLNNLSVDPRLSAAVSTIADPNGSGSSNRVGFGLSDFGKTYQAPAAPNVVGTGKHAGGKTSLQQAAINALTAQYGPVLGAINSAIGSTRSQAAKDRADAQARGNRAEGDVATLYARLRQYAGNTERAQNADYRRGVKNTKANFNNLRQDINSSYTGSSGEVANEMRRMGIDPAIALQGAAKDMAFTNAMVREDRGNQINNTRASRREYDAGMGHMKNDIIATGNAAVGSQRSQTNAQIADINRQLSQNIMQLQLQRAQTVGQRAAALAQYKLSQVQAKAAGKDPMAHLNLLIKQAQLAKTLKQLNDPGTSTTAKPGKGMGDALAYLNNLYPEGTANWSTMKRNQLSQLLEDAQTQGSMAKPKAGVGVWDPKQEGDVLNYLFKQMAGVKGPKGNPMYGAQDKQAMQQALMIALGLM